MSGAAAEGASLYSSCLLPPRLAASTAHAAATPVQVSRRCAGVTRAPAVILQNRVVLIQIYVRVGMKIYKNTNKGLKRSCAGSQTHDTHICTPQLQATRSKKDPSGYFSRKDVEGRKPCAPKAHSKPTRAT